MARIEIKESMPGLKRIYRDGKVVAYYHVKPNELALTCHVSEQDQATIHTMLGKEANVKDPPPDIPEEHQL